MFGDPVRRGPIPSARPPAKSITCEWCRPSSRIKLYSLMSIDSVLGCCICESFQPASGFSAALAGFLSVALDTAGPATRRIAAAKTMARVRPMKYLSPKRNLILASKIAPLYAHPACPPDYEMKIARFAVEDPAAHR